MHGFFSHICMSCRGTSENQSVFPRLACSLLLNSISQIPFFDPPPSLLFSLSPPHLPLLFLSSSTPGANPGGASSSPPANYAYDNRHCWMTVVVGHAYRQEGTFLPSARIESAAHRVHVTLDKRINVFHRLAQPVINVTKVGRGGTGRGERRR